MLIANWSSFRGINANCCSSLSLPFSSFLFGLSEYLNFLGYVVSMYRLVGWNVMYIMQPLGLLSLFFKGEEKEKENDKETDSYKQSSLSPPLFFSEKRKCDLEISQDARETNQKGIR